MTNKIYIILGGGLIKEKNKWRTTNFNEENTFCADGSNIRMVAGSYLYKNDHKSSLIASGGKGQYKNIPNAPNVSSVLKKELIELGIPEKKIIEEKKSNNTWQQLQELKKIINKNKIKQIVVISNKYHLSRITAMIKKDNELNKLFEQSVIKLKSAEDIVLKYSPKKWKSIIKNAYNSELIKQRIKLEEKGVQDIKTGIYKLE